MMLVLAVLGAAAVASSSALAGAGAAGAAAAAGSAMKRPNWGWDIASAPGVTSATECFNASGSAPAIGGSSAVEQQRRPAPSWRGLSGPAPVQWVHWAAPVGPVPRSGFPVFVMFEVEGWLPPNASACAADRRWPAPPPPPPPACVSLLEQMCNASRANWTACHRCWNMAQGKAKTDGLNCSVGVYPSGKFAGKPRPWDAKFCGCSDGGEKFVPCQQPYHHHAWPVTYGPFSTPDESIEWAFQRNGSLNQSVAGSESAEADFPQAGLIWIQRIKQYLIANGVAVVILNPLVSDGWDWDTDTDWTNGTDRPYLHRLFSAMRDGTFPAGQLANTRLFDTNRVVPAGYSVGAQMASWMIQTTVSGEFTAANVSAAVMMSGGSHLCYRNNPNVSTTLSVPQSTCTCITYLPKADVWCVYCSGQRSPATRTLPGAPHRTLCILRLVTVQPATRARSAAHKS